VGRHDGTVVAITGTSRGIGAGIVDHLVGEGALVIGLSRGETPAREGYTHVRGDLAADPPERLLEAALAAHGRVDALVNNAGAQHNAACWEQTDAEFDDMLEINLTAPFLLSQAFARHWVEGGAPGVVVNVCSIESQVIWPSPAQSGYATTKGGLLGLTRSMAFDLAAHGVRVVAVGPGAIETEMSPEDRSYGARIPLGHAAGTPRDVAGAVSFLISEDAAYVTGEIVYVDGGYLLP
jgi:NAD(P)-dependent dehydrogenase (short-subunit alcohol dehydrogenase family)